MMLEHRVMSQHMLEMKISEAGPYNQRAEPPHVTNARTALLAEGAIYEIECRHARGIGNTTLFAHSSVNISNPTPSDHTRLTDVLDGYRVWRAAAQKKTLCGGILERAVHEAAIASAPPITVLGNPGVLQDQTINGIRIQGEFDHLIVAGGELIVVEDKNLRQWLYPQRKEVWQAIAKALAADDAVPLLVTRKAPPALVSFFARIGGLAFQTNNQLFAPDLSSRFALVVGKKGLNFFDIRFDPSRTTQTFAQFLVNTVQRTATEKRALFRKTAPVLRPYAAVAANDGLSDHHYHALLEQLV